MSESIKPVITENGNPLVTFALFTYNQERFIAEAIKGALSQTYSPLEIIISDDCSTDNTWDVIRREVANYTGPHHLVLNRNAVNIGVRDHVNRILSMSNGVLVVMAAGDDVSLPNRVEIIVGAWRSSSASAVCTNATLIDENGHYLRDWIVHSKNGFVDKYIKGKRIRIPSITGATVAFEHALYKDFGDIPMNVRNEDLDLAFRAYFKNGICYLEEKLVLYRKHNSNLSYWAQIENHSSILDRVVLKNKSMKNLSENIKNSFRYFRKTNPNDVIGNFYFYVLIAMTCIRRYKIILIELFLRFASGIHKFIKSSLVFPRLVVKRLLKRLFFSGMPKIVVASTGRSGSTMIVQAIADGLVAARFGYLPATMRIYLGRQALDYLARISDIKTIFAPVIKTHDLYNKIHLQGMKCIFVFGDPLESALSVMEMGRKYGMEWVRLHLYHLVSNGSPDDIFHKDILNYEAQLKSWGNAEGVFVVHYDDIWARQKELSQYVGFEVCFPTRKERSAKKLPIDYDKNLFEYLKRLESDLRDRSALA